LDLPESTKNRVPASPAPLERRNVQHVLLYYYPPERRCHCDPHEWEAQRGRPALSPGLPGSAAGAICSRGRRSRVSECRVGSDGALARGGHWRLFLLRLDLGSEGDLFLVRPIRTATSADGPYTGGGE